MSARLSLMLLAGLCLAPVGCKSPQDKPIPMGPSTALYDYTAYDRSGGVVIEGVFSIDYDTPSRFHGEWRFKQVRPSDEIGPQVGAGSLTGTISRGRVTVTLSSSSREHVELVGSFGGVRLDGDWIWTGLSGRLSRGKFVARRK